jgi:5-hydroxyisourate hydrolase
MTVSSRITTHVVDTSAGRPAGGMEFELARRTSATDGWEVITKGVTNADGRSTALQIDGAPIAGVYRLKFATGGFFERRGIATFFPTVSVEFLISAAVEHYHVPLLISPFGYSTYRGS